MIHTMQQTAVDELLSLRLRDLKESIGGLGADVYQKQETVRMKTAAIILISGFLLFNGLSHAEASTAKRFDKATKTCRIITYQDIRDGYKLFESNCKSCHYRGNKKHAKFLYSESKVRKGWNRVFATRYTRCAKNGSWNKLTAEQLATVNDYLFESAADTVGPYAKPIGKLG